VFLGSALSDASPAKLISAVGDPVGALAGSLDDLWHGRLHLPGSFRRIAPHVEAVRLNIVIIVFVVAVGQDTGPAPGGRSPRPLASTGLAARSTVGEPRVTVHPWHRLRELLARPDIVPVIGATPHYSQVEIARAASPSSKHVLSRSPRTTRR